MLLLWGFFTDPTLAFAQHSSSSEISGLPIILLLGEYWMLHIGPGILAIVWFCSSSSPTLPYPSPVSKLVQRHTGRLRKRDNLLTSDGGGGARSRIIRAQESLFLYIFIQYSPLLMYKNPGCLCRYETEWWSRIYVSIYTVDKYCFLWELSVPFCTVSVHWCPCLAESKSTLCNTL